jgi:hypothetical protein
MDLKMEYEREHRLRLQTERQLAALQTEFLEYKSHVERELERTATEQVSIQTRLIEQSVELAEAKAMIDDLINSSSAPPTASNDQQPLLNYFFKSDEQAYYKNRCAELEKEKAQIEDICEQRFKEWKSVVLERVNTERKHIRGRLNNQESPMHEQNTATDEPHGGEEDDELSYMFDKLDWTKPMPRNN